MLTKDTTNSFKESVISELDELWPRVVIKLRLEPAPPRPPDGVEFGRLVAAWRPGASERGEATGGLIQKVDSLYLMLDSADAPAVVHD